MCFTLNFENERQIRVAEVHSPRPVLASCVDLGPHGYAVSVKDVLDPSLQTACGRHVVFRTLFEVRAERRDAVAARPTHVRKKAFDGGSGEKPAGPETVDEAGSACRVAHNEQVQRQEFRANDGHVTEKHGPARRKLSDSPHTGEVGGPTRPVRRHNGWGILATASKPPP